MKKLEIRGEVEMKLKRYVLISDKTRFSGDIDEMIAKYDDSTEFQIYDMQNKVMNRWNYDVFKIISHIVKDKTHPYYSDGAINILYGIDTNDSDYTYDLGIVIKTSDNILDLVEVGDLVEVLFTGNDTYYKLEVLELNEHIIRLSHLTLDIKSFKGFSYSKKDMNIKLPFCKSIYKCQPNGDYKRYEVK